MLFSRKGVGNDKFKKSVSTLKTHIKRSSFFIRLQTSRNLIGKDKGSLPLNTRPFQIPGKKVWLYKPI